MAEVRILDLAEAPEEGQGKQVKFEHPLTDIDLYLRGIFRQRPLFGNHRHLQKMRIPVLLKGKLDGMYALCAREDHPWHIKTGLFKFDRTQSIPTYRVTVKDEGLYIEI